MTQVIGIDAGNFETKVIHAKGYDCFSSMIGEWNHRVQKDVHSNQDMEFEIFNKYEHHKGFAGPLAIVESEYGGTIYGISKNHYKWRIRVLLAVYRNIIGNEVSIVLGQPFKGHEPEIKQDMIDSLVGEHKVTVNGKMKQFEIKDIKIGIEGAMAYITKPIKGPCNVIDVGSGTVNCLHFLDGKLVNRKCDTLPFGSETSKNGVNFEGMASGIFSAMSGVWNPNDPTISTGSNAEIMESALRQYYKKVETFRPVGNIGGVLLKLHPKFANALGMYETGVKVFGELPIG